MAETEQDRQYKALFVNLIVMLSSSAMQQMGKLINPLTGKTETNLDAAQMTIDMLSMLESKSRGNRDADEERMLKEILSTLQLNYVDAAAAPQPASGAAPEAKAESTPAVESATADAGTPPTGSTADSKKDPKFRKSYG